jgi:hemerythrin
MDRVGYPVAAQHKELHRKLVKQVSEMASQWRNEQAVSVVEVAEFLKVWLIQHIGENDRPLASHLGAKGKSAAVAV